MMEFNKKFLCHGKQTLFKGVYRAEKAFTLVELISAFAIIAILAAMAIPAYSSYILKVKIARTIVEIRMLGNEIANYGAGQVISDPTDLNLPDTLDVIGYGSLLDPWGRPYQYLRIAGGDVKGKGKLRRDRFVNPLNTDYDLYSMGPDSDTKTNLNSKESWDDIVRATNGAYIGIASDF
jgi:general secretion pathway protein G